MLKIVYPICCGMDVHKSFIVTCITSINDKCVTTYQSKCFSIFTGELRCCTAWLAKHNYKDVCIESTRKYWIPVYNILEPTCNIVLAHPKYVKAIRGKKTDKKDAKWIVDIFKHDLVSSSFIPPADIRQHEKITDVSDFRTKGVKASHEEILATVDGEIFSKQTEKLRIIRSHMDSLALCKTNLESLILSTAEKYLPQIELIMTVPSIQSFATIGILSEIEADMSVFPTSKHLCSWAGLTPQNNESSRKKKTTRIIHASAYLEPV